MPISNQTRLLDDYQESLSTPNIKGADAFKHYKVNVLNDRSLLQELVLPGADKDSKKLSELLKDTPDSAAANKLKADLANAFKYLDSFSQAETTFQEDYATLEKAAKKSPPGVSILDIPRHLEIISQAAQEKIKVQQQHITNELKKIDVTDIEKTFGVDKNIAEDIKKQMLQKLEENHKKQNDDFTKTLTNAKDQVFQGLLLDRQRIAQLKLLEERDKAIKEQIDDVVRKQLGNQLQVTQGLDKKRYKDIRVSQLSGITSVTGRGITINGDNYELSSKSFLRNLPIVGSILNACEGDDDQESLIALANTMKANGVEEVTMTINGTTDTKAAAELARKTYRACILAGYPPEKITIKWNNQEEKKVETYCGRPDDDKAPAISAAEKLYPGEQFKSVLNALHKEGESIRKLQKDSVSSLKSDNEIKNELTTFRHTDTAEKAAKKAEEAAQKAQKTTTEEEAKKCIIAAQTAYQEAEAAAEQTPVFKTAQEKQTTYHNAKTNVTKAEEALRANPDDKALQSALEQAKKVLKSAESAADAAQKAMESSPAKKAVDQAELFLEKTRTASSTEKINARKEAAELAAAQAAPGGRPA